MSIFHEPQNIPLADLIHCPECGIIIGNTNDTIKKDEKCIECESKEMMNNENR